jgi:hypothetical protein
VTWNAERSEVFEIRVAPFDDRQDVIGFPPRLALLVNEAVLLERPQFAHALAEGHAHDFATQFVRVEVAQRTNAFVALEDTFAQI